MPLRHPESSDFKSDAAPPGNRAADKAILRPILTEHAASQQLPDPRTERLRTCKFLLMAHIDAATLAAATVRAVEWSVPVHQALIDLGWVSEGDYVAALAHELGVGTVDGRHLRLPMGADPPHSAALLAVDEGSVPRLIAAAVAFSPETLLPAVAATGRAPKDLLLATRTSFNALRQAGNETRMLRQAARGLVQVAPELSARAHTARWQKLAGFGLATAAAALAVHDPDLAVQVFLVAISLPLLCMALLRILGLVELLLSDAGKPRGAPAQPPDDATLPIYSVMVALYDEADVLPRLVAGLMALDYPASRLDILLVLEARDPKTQAAAAALDLPGNMRIIVVPEGGPQTKPKALNYALNFIRGEYVVVFDAEDRPEPGQLRIALARFAAGGEDLACVQACLNTYNPNASWLTRQFTLEYTVLFDVLLPALERLRLPLPLGGTSNHFRTRILLGIGAWDPYNVTEDADIGIRLARVGLRTATIPSTTWEEAPRTYRNWRNQRTRWLKGWLQTWLVHTREPRRLTRELGLGATLGLQMLMAGILFAVLAHPVVYLLVGYEAWQGRFPWASDEDTPGWLAWMALANLALGLFSSIALAAIATIRRGRPRLAWATLLMPFYWLLVSLAGYRALVQLVVKPYLWEKTQHGSSKAGED